MERTIDDFFADLRAQFGDPPDMAAQPELLNDHSFTCADCLHITRCPFAFDGYNRNGDCLAEK